MLEGGKTVEHAAQFGDEADVAQGGNRPRSECNLVGDGDRAN